MMPSKKLVLYFSGVIALTILAGNFLFSHQQKKQPYVDAVTKNFTIPEALSQSPQPSFADLVKRVKPSVVNISTTKQIQTRHQDPYFRDFFNPYGTRTDPTAEKRPNSLGTGFIINDQGHVLTNNHVIEGADEIIVRLDDGQEIQAKVVGRDARLDIAILQLAKKVAHVPASLGDSDALSVGDWVIAVGNPFGLGQTVTSGIVSAKARVLGAGPYDDFIQTDASINPGNSGGPLFNLKGEVVGINTAIIATGQGLGFAIPINLAKEIIPQLITKGKVSRGWLGVAIREVSQSDAEKNALAKPMGAYIEEVVPDGPADRAGIKAGDILVALGGEAVDTSHSLPTIVARHAPGQEIEIAYIHAGKLLKQRVLLGSLDHPESTPNTESGEDLFGLSLRNLTPSEKQRVRQGVLVTAVADGSNAEAIGFVAGDVILEINGQPISNVALFKKMLSQFGRGTVLRMALARGSQIYYFAFRKD